jgi:hypothetical protein
VRREARKYFLSPSHATDMADMTQRNRVDKAYDLCKHYTTDRDLACRISALKSELLMLSPHKLRMPCKLPHLGKCCATCRLLQTDMKRKYKGARGKREYGLRTAYESSFGVISNKALELGNWDMCNRRDQGHQQRALRVRALP